MLKFGLKTPYATLLKVARSNLGSLLVLDWKKTNFHLILFQIVQVGTVIARNLKFELKTPYVPY